MYHNSPYFSSFSLRTFLFVGVCVGFALSTLNNLFNYKTISPPAPPPVNNQLTIQKNHAEFRNESYQFPSTNIDNSRFRPRKVLPHCIVIGVGKCGTTAFSLMLNDSIPNIQMKEEESYFFRNDDIYAKGIDYYKESLPTMTTSQDIIMERTSDYYGTNMVPKRIFSVLPKVKLILIVCDPLKRTVSDFLQQIYKERLPKRFTTLEQYLEGYMENRDIVKRSIYANYWKPWLSLFPRNQILILNGNILRCNPYSILKQTEEFLGLRNFVRETDFILKNGSPMYCWKVRYEYNSTRCLHDTKLKGRPHPNISQQLMTWMKDYFTPHNQRFFDQIGLKFNWTMDEP